MQELGHRSEESKEKILLGKENKKRCYLCKRILDYSKFPLRKSATDGLHGYCRECLKKESRLYAQKKEQRIKKQKRESSIEFLERLREYRKTSNVYKKYRKSYQRKYVCNKFRNSREYRLKAYLRNRIWSSLKVQGVKKQTKFIDLIGCTINEFTVHIEKRWEEGMLWDNYGRGLGKWSIDHIIPCASFDLTSIEEQKKCFHYTNLQPLWVTDNSSKGAKYNGIDYRNFNKK